MAATDIWRPILRPAIMKGVESAFDHRDVQGVLAGIFDTRATLDEIRDELRLIRSLLEDGDEEEEEEEDDS